MAIATLRFSNDSFGFITTFVLQECTLLSCIVCRLEGAIELAVGH